jgi:hypothetical protein
MKLQTSTNNGNTKQLFLKKNIVVKFIAVNRVVKKGLTEKRNDTETTTSGTIPTTSSIIYTLV